MRQNWDRFIERLRPRIYARLDKLEARVAKLEVRIVDKPVKKFIKPVPVVTPEASTPPLNSISVPIGDGQRTVTFRGIELSQRFYAEDLKRITETLYGTGLGQYLVYVRTLHRGKGLRTEYALREVSEDDLKGCGQYAALGQLRVPVTLEEALRA